MPHVDINPFGEHDKTDTHPDEGENIPLPPVTPGGGSTWEPECEQEMSFGGGKTRKKDHLLLCQQFVQGAT